MKKRKREKIIKKSVIIYDYAAAPFGMQVRDLLMMMDKGIIFYNSEFGDKPEIYPKRNSRVFKFKNEK